MNILLILCASIGTASAQDNTKLPTPSVKGNQIHMAIDTEGNIKFSGNGAA